jgi:hypothetical protein
MITLALNYSKVQKNLPSINWKAFCCVGFFMMLVLLVFYVWQINDLTRGSYTINSYENQISKLSDENKNLQVSFAESSFLGQALTKIQAMNFQKTTSVKYVQVMDSVATIQK